MSATGSDRLLVVMAKAPRPGHVKTRLLPRFGDEAVVGLYRCLMEDTLDLAASLGDSGVALMCPAGDAPALRTWLGSSLRIIEQSGDGLADALHATFQLFEPMRARRIIAFNCDSPHLPSSVLRDAFDALTDHDLVVGPTDDGGYYLVGARRAHPGLFDRAPLGTQRALDALMTRAREQGLSTATTETWYDVDVGGDVDRLARDLATGTGEAPRTRVFLGALVRR